MLIIDLPYTSKVEDSFRNEIKTVQWNVNTRPVYKMRGA
jgi:hypothetical protein